LWTVWGKRELKEGTRLFVIVIIAIIIGNEIVTQRKK